MSTWQTSCHTSSLVRSESAIDLAFMALPICFPKAQNSCAESGRKAIAITGFLEKRGALLYQPQHLLCLNPEAGGSLSDY